MFTLRIEHPISDYDTWKAAFDADPAQRRQSGVIRYAIHQPVDDPHGVLIDLEFADVEQARSMLARLQGVWSSAQAAPALAGTPKTAIIDTRETITV